MSIHPHRREGPSGRRELALALVLTSSVMCVEFVAGLVSGSLALLADAGHMLTDASALTLSLFAAWIAERPPTPEKTYGYYRTEILAALVNGVAMWLIVVWIYVRALHRLHHPTEVQTGLMLLAAVLGLIANLASSQILTRASTQNLNVRGAQLHVLGDALGSCGVIIAGILMRLKGWRLADPMASLFIGFLIAGSSWILISQAVTVLLEATPRHIDIARLTDELRAVNGVRDVHDLHAWTITTGLEAMSGHLIVDQLERGPEILEAVNALLRDRLNITHTTFQLELAQTTTSPASA